jgi:hypothetical protein
MNKITCIGASVLLATQWQVVSSNAAETMARFKPDRQLEGRLLRSAEPPSKRWKKGAVPLTRETVSAAVDARIKVLFDRAADPAMKLVTRSSAEKSGVGYFTGHFADIDRDNDGALSFKEVKGFLDAQPPIAGAESKKLQTLEEKEVQIIE